MFCVIPTCCCGFQQLGQGLFIFAMFDIFLNLLMLGLSMFTGASSVVGGFIIIADIALAVGAKMQVGHQQGGGGGGGGDY